MSELVADPAPGALQNRIPRFSRYTYRYHLRAEILNNLFLGIFGLYEAVARKGLRASQLEVTLLTMASAVFMISSSYWAFRMQNRDKSSFILWAALFGRGALLFMALISQSTLFVILCCAVFLSETVFLPAQNSIFQSNYHPSWLGRILGQVVVRTKWFHLAGALLCGYLLDRDPQLYRILFPVAALIGILSYVQYARIRIRHRAHDGESMEGGTIRNFVRVLRNNPAFDRFERNYFIYGTAFMMLLPTNIFLLVDHLHLSYSEFSLAKLVIFQVMIAVAAPLAGRLFDRWKPVRMAGTAFLLLASYPLLLFAACMFRSVLLTYIGFAVFGTAMSGVMTSWNLGAIHFSGARDSAAFMGVHATAVGVRGLFAPFLGLASTRVLGLGGTYLLAAGLFLTASGLMFRLHRHIEAIPEPSA